MSATARKPILVVEDDVGIRENLEEFLGSEGYPVKLAGHGRDGLAIIRELKGQCLVLLDLQMPVMTGEELLDELSRDADPAIRSTQIVVLTARSAPFQHAVAGFVRKPMDLDDLLATIQTLNP